MAGKKTNPPKANAAATDMPRGILTDKIADRVFASEDPVALAILHLSLNVGEEIDKLRISLCAGDGGGAIGELSVMTSKAIDDGLGHIGAAIAARE